MKHAFLVAAGSLPDDELIAQLRHLAARERGATAELVAHLAELESRDLHRAAGYRSMFSYCRDVRLLSEHEAYNRIEVARAARRFPLVLDLLMEGAVNLTTVRLLAPHLTMENHHAVLTSARGRSRAQVEELVARLAPRPEVAASVRKLPDTAPATAPGPAVAMPATEPPPVVEAVAPLPPPPPPLDRARADIRPLSPERFKMQLTISGDVVEKLRLAKDLLSHANPSGSEAVVLERALDVLLADLLKKKFAATERPRPGGSPRNVESRQPPAEVKRAVFLRDRGRCAYVASDGHRCGERAFLEFHHVRPYAHGGTATVANIQLRCRRHDEFEWQTEIAELRRLEEDWYLTRRPGVERTRAGAIEGSWTSARFETSTPPRFARPDDMKCDRGGRAGRPISSPGAAVR